MTKLGRAIAICDTVNLNFCKQRKRLAHKLNNPRVLEIGFHTSLARNDAIRQNKGYPPRRAETGLHEHHNILKSTQLVNIESDECYSATAKTVEEACKLVEAGFGYVCEFDGVKVFRKHK